MPRLGPCGLELVFLQMIKHYNFLYLLPPANEVWGKVIFSEACVKNSLHRGVPQCMLGYHPPGPCTHPLGPCTPPDHAPRDHAHPPGTMHTPGPCTPWDHAPPWNHAPPPGAQHAGKYGQRAGGTHPTGMQSYLHFLPRWF